MGRGGAAALATTQASTGLAFDLANRAIEIWAADLHDPDWPLDDLEALLSEEEVTRAERFHIEVDRRNFVIGRGLLRQLLSRYTGLESVALTTNPWGKPLMRDPAPASSVAFNVSHAAGLMVLAFGRGEAIGVDVELIDEDVEHLELAERFFAPAERAKLAALPADEVAHGFFNCWTRKEAFVKAHGMGLSLPLDSFEVSLRPGEPAELLWVDADLLGARDWELRAFVPRAGYRAALVLGGPVGVTRQIALTPETLSASRGLR